MISYLAENVNCGISKQNPVEVFFVQSSVVTVFAGVRFPCSSDNLPRSYEEINRRSEEHGFHLQDLKGPSGVQFGLKLYE